VTPKRRSPAVGRRAQELIHVHGHAWRDSGLARRLSLRAARRARIHLLVVLPMVAGELLIYHYRDRLLGPAWDTPVSANGCASGAAVSPAPSRGW
jgi:hypothetical protein